MKSFNGLQVLYVTVKHGRDSSLQGIVEDGPNAEHAEPFLFPEGDLPVDGILRLGVPSLKQVRVLLTKGYRGPFLNEDDVEKLWRSCQNLGKAIMAKAKIARQAQDQGTTTIEYRKVD